MSAESRSHTTAHSTQDSTSPSTLSRLASASLPFYNANCVVMGSAMIHKANHVPPQIPAQSRTPSSSTQTTEHNHSASVIASAGRDIPYTTSHSAYRSFSFSARSLDSIRQSGADCKEDRIELFRTFLPFPSRSNSDPRTRQHLADTDNRIQDLCHLKLWPTLNHGQRDQYNSACSHTDSANPRPASSERCVNSAWKRICRKSSE